METIISMDAHKRYSQFCVQSQPGSYLDECRVDHRPGAIRGYLQHWPDAEAVAVETIGNYYWLVDEIEQAGKQPLLVHAHKAKLMLGMVNKTDKLDARGLNRLQRTGTLPTVWIPSGRMRDQRELPRVRMVLANERTRIKNRIHSVFDKYGLQHAFGDLSDIYGAQGRRIMATLLGRLPAHTRYTARLLLRRLDQVEQDIGRFEKRMKKVFLKTESVQRLMTLPGIGFILAVVIACEIGSIDRFASAPRFASYAGTVPRVHSSGGKTRYGKLRQDVNHYLKWAFCEAGNAVCLNHKRLPQRHVSVLYKRIKQKKGHPKAIGAVARHLAEASWWMLSKQENYQEPNSKKDVTTTA